MEELPCTPGVHPPQPLQQVLELCVLHLTLHSHHCLLLILPRSSQKNNHKCPVENILEGLDFCNPPFPLP